MINSAYQQHTFCINSVKPSNRQPSNCNTEEGILADGWHRQQK